VSEQAVYRAPGEGAAASSEHEEGGTFPAGTALAALFVWFVLARALANITARRPLLHEVATFTGVFGAVLAALALVGALAMAARAASGGARVLHASRAVIALPVAFLVFASMFGEPRASVQWAGLLAALGTLWASCLTGMLRPGAIGAARATLLLFLVGESIELGYAPAQAFLSPAGAGGQAVAWLGRVAEGCTLAGAFGATLWAYRAGVRAVGAARTRLFLPFPAGLGAVMVALVVALPASVAAVLGRTTFGARFDLVTHEGATSVHRAALFGYLLAPVLLLGSTALSMASAGYDNGAGSRRSLGWLLVLFAGFGVLRLAGPMDPIRLVMVSLAAVLLERAGDRERVL
jgi:hypothetical protein